ncbi:MAG: hypothetical protein GY850_06600 [bacterium]|nr:hypothetical protein [bacterium]
MTNYKAVYRHPSGPGNTYGTNNYKPLEDIFAENPDILFIPVTAPPRHYGPSDATNDTEAHRARLFNNWLKNDWLSDYNADNPSLNNVAVFDWFDVLASADDHVLHPNRLKNEYGGNAGDSHPNSPANAYSTAIFATNPVNFIDIAWGGFSTYASQASGNWSESSIWDRGEPKAGDTITISDGTTVTVDTDAQCWRITVDQNATLIIADNAALTVVKTI